MSTVITLPVVIAEQLLLGYKPILSRTPAQDKDNRPGRGGDANRARLASPCRRYNAAIPIAHPACP
jgi:hypothetical protein